MALPSVVKKIFLLPLLFLVLLVLASLIEPTKTITDIPRGDMNCPNTNNFNQTQWDNSISDANNHTIYSTGCYALHWDMFAFVGGLTALAIWGWFNL